MSYILSFPAQSSDVLLDGVAFASSYSAFYAATIQKLGNPTQKMCSTGETVVVVMVEASEAQESRRKRQRLDMGN